MQHRSDCERRAPKKLIEDKRLRLAGRLCLLWGIADVSAWRDSLDGTRVLNFWEAFDMLEPIGLPGLDQIAAVQTSHYVSCHRQPAAHPDECHAFPNYDKLASRVKMTPEERVQAEQALFM